MKKGLKGIYYLSIIVMLVLGMLFVYRLSHRPAHQVGESREIRYSIYQDGSEVFVLVTVRNDDDRDHGYLYNITYFWENQSRSTSLHMHFGKGAVKTSKISTIIYTSESVGANLKIFKDRELVEEGTIYAFE